MYKYFCHMDTSPNLKAMKVQTSSNEYFYRVMNISTQSGHPLNAWEGSRAFNSFLPCV